MNCLLSPTGSRDGTVRVWAVPSGALITAFHMNIGVEDLQMSFDASHIVVRLQEGGCAPLLCLHNSPAADIKSQSQVDIDFREGGYTVLLSKLCAVTSVGINDRQ